MSDKLKTPYDYGFEYGLVTAQATGTTEEPTHGWAAHLIPSNGNFEEVSLLFYIEQEETTRIEAALEQYRKGCLNGAKAALKTRGKPERPAGPTVDGLRKLGYRVRVLHDRLVDVSTEYEEIEGEKHGDRKFYLGKETRTLNARGGQTKVNVWTGGDTVSSGWAARSVCHENDNYNKAIGLEIALQRVVNLMVDVGREIPGAQSIFEFALYGEVDIRQEIVVLRAFINASSEEEAKKKLKSSTEKRIQGMTLRFCGVLQPAWFSGDPKAVLENVRIY